MLPLVLLLIIAVIIKMQAQNSLIGKLPAPLNKYFNSNASLFICIYLLYVHCEKLSNHWCNIYAKKYASDF